MIHFLILNLVNNWKFKKSAHETFYCVKRYTCYMCNNKHCLYIFSFNRIDIPPYESYEKLYAKLTCAVEETCGFAVEWWTVYSSTLPVSFITLIVVLSKHYYIMPSNARRHMKQPEIVRQLFRMIFTEFSDLVYCGWTLILTLQMLYHGKGLTHRIKAVATNGMTGKSKRWSFQWLLNQQHTMVVIPNTFLVNHVCIYFNHQTCTKEDTMSGQEWSTSVVCHYTFESKLLFNSISNFVTVMCNRQYLFVLQWIQLFLVNYVQYNELCSELDTGILRWNYVCYSSPCHYDTVLICLW